MSDAEILKNILKELGQSSERWGMSNAFAKIWGILYLEGEMTQDDLSEKLSVAVSAVSQSLKTLQTMGLVVVVGKKGRKNIYAAEESMSSVKKTLFRNKLLLEIEPMIEILQHSAKKAKTLKLKKQLTSMLSKYESLRRFMKAMLRFPL